MATQQPRNPGGPRPTPSKSTASKGSAAKPPSKTAAAKSAAASTTTTMKAVGQKLQTAVASNLTTEEELRGTRPVRRARLRLTRIDPWSVVKTSFALSCCMAVVTVVAVTVVWAMLGSAGVFGAINDAVSSVNANDTESFDIKDYISTGRVMGFTILISIIDIVLFTALATLGAYLYNMTATLLGGVEVTLTEDR